MRVDVLVENSLLEGGRDLHAEFGLSLHIEHEGRKTLFDTGTSGVFADNAEAMGITIADVDVAVLSHHHFDHGGGLQRFFELNQRATVYLRESAGKNQTFRALGLIRRPIGLDPDVIRENRDRLRFVKEKTEIAPGVFVLTRIANDHPRPRGNKYLFIERDGALVPDTMDHELMMVISEEDGMAVFTGCSHSGVLNMISTAVSEFPGVKIKAVLGGFHLVGLPFLKTMAGSRSEVEEIGRQILAQVKGTVYTGHCTGEKAYGILSGVMGETLQKMPTGATIEV